MRNKKTPISRDGDNSVSGGANSYSKADILKMAGANKILAALPAADLETLATKLKPIDFKIDKAFYRTDDGVEHVYFPTSGIISLLTLLENGTTVEVAVIGAEGMLGISAVMGAKNQTHEALTQSEGRALKMRAAD